MQSKLTNAREGVENVVGLALAGGRAGRNEWLTCKWPAIKVCRTLVGTLALRPLRNLLQAQYM